MKANHLIRVAIAAAAIGSLAPSAQAVTAPNFSGSFYCQPRESWVFSDIPGVGKVPVTLKVVVPGAGFVSNMSGSVVCYCDDETIDLKTGAGTATYTLRDATGDTIVMRLEAQNAPPSPTSAHSITYQGTFQVASGTGRFAGACGAGKFSGWSDDDPPAKPGDLPTTGLGYWEFEGSIAVSSAQDPSLLQLSARATVGPAGNVAILAFQVCGTATRSFLIRGVGPTLAQFGVTGALQNPVLTVMKRNGDLVATNDDWADQPASGPTVASLASIATRVGAFPLPATSKDSAIFLTLAPGTYTVGLAGVGTATGAGLIEVYEVR